MRQDKEFFNFKLKENQEIEITTIVFKHGNSLSDFDLMKNQMEHVDYLI